jgi:hypothetical protein
MQVRKVGIPDFERSCGGAIEGGAVEKSDAIADGKLEPNVAIQSPRFSFEDEGQCRLGAKQQEKGKEEAEKKSEIHGKRSG